MKKAYFNVDEYLNSAKTEVNHGADGTLQQSLQNAADGQTEFNRLASQASLRPPAPYVINVSNTTAGNLTCVLFGTNLYLQSTNYGSSTGVAVASASTNITYFQMLMQVITQPYDVSKLRLIGSSSTQATQTINLDSVDSSGQKIDSPIFGAIYQSSFQNNPLITDIDYPFTVDANTSLSFTILAGATAVVVFFPLTKTNPVKTLGGSAAITNYGPAPATIGIPNMAVLGAVRPGLG